VRSFSTCCGAADRASSIPCPRRSGSRRPAALEQRRWSPPSLPAPLRGLAATLLALPLLVASCAPAPATRAVADLTNPYLGPAYSGWLIGPVVHLTSSTEVAEFLALRSDQQAERFIARFWSERDPRPEEPGNPVRELFESRAQEADRRYSEAGYAGRRTARGTVWVLHGAPEKVEFEVNPHARQPPIEVWRYPRDAEPGLDGREPRAAYRFVKQGDLTVSYEGALRQMSRPPRPGPRPGEF
jgi:GWxTD domain-containing protein